MSWERQCTHLCHWLSEGRFHLLCRQFGLWQPSRLLLMRLELCWDPQPSWPVQLLRPEAPELLLAAQGLCEGLQCLG